MTEPTDTQLAHLAAQAVWFSRETRRIERRKKDRAARATELLGRVRAELRGIEKLLGNLQP